MPRKHALKSQIFDDKDIELMLLLQEDGRKSLTEIAQKVGLSIDSVNNRIVMLKEKGIITKIGAWINPRAAGYSLVVDNKIKLQNITEEEKQRFIEHLIGHSRVIEVATLLGDFDITCVIIAKNTEEYEKISLDIRQKFSHLIADWKSVLILNIYKFEEYSFDRPIKREK